MPNKHEHIKEFLRGLAAKIQDLRETDIANFATEFPNFTYDDGPLFKLENHLFQAQTIAEELSAD